MEGGGDGREEVMGGGGDGREEVMAYTECFFQGEVGEENVSLQHIADFSLHFLAQPLSIHGDAPACKGLLSC